MAVGDLGAGVEFRILGPLEVVRDGVLVELGGSQQRALLAVLLLNRRRVVSTDRLIDELWRESPPATASKTVQVYVSRLRKALGDGVLVTRGGGYALDVAPQQVDVDRFELLASEGRGALESGDPQLAARHLRKALELWRGPPLADLEYEPFAQAGIGRLEEERLAALGDRIDAELSLGEHQRLVGELDAVARGHPLHERFQAQLMLALYRSGRQADALERYQQARRRLVDELGVEPGPALRDLERAILVHDPSLDAPKRLAAAAAPRTRRATPLLLVGSAVLLGAVVAIAISLTGSGPNSVRVAPNSLAAIDTRSNSIVGAIPVGARPGAIAFGSGSLWVANQDDQTVSRIDPGTLSTDRTLPLTGPPTGLAASANAIWAVESNPSGSTVFVNAIDPQFDTVGRTSKLGNVVRGGPAGVAARGNAVWVAPSSGLLARLDPATGHVVQQLDPNSGPAAIALGDGATWVTDTAANNVTRIDPTGLLTAIAVGNGPTGIAAGDGGVWVADSLDDAVVRIDPDTSSVTTTIRVGRSPAGIALGAGSVWVANSGDGTVSRIDPDTNRVTATIRVGGSPQAIALADGRAWVTVDAQTIAPSSPASSGTLRIESATNVDYTDPALAYQQNSWQLLYAVCAKLLNYPDVSGPAGSRLIPEVARSLPSVSADGETYTFRIRSGFRFSPPSNAPVTAETFKDTIERTLNPRMNSPTAHYLADIIGAGAYMAGKASHIAGLTASGDTLTIHLLHPDPDFPARIALPSFCAVPPGTPIDPKGLATIPSAGPYYVASYTPGQGVVLERNPEYHGSRPRRFARIELAVGIPTSVPWPTSRPGTRTTCRLRAHKPMPARSATSSRRAIEPGTGLISTSSHRYSSSTISSSTRTDRCSPTRVCAERSTSQSIAVRWPRWAMPSRLCPSGRRTNTCRRACRATATHRSTHPPQT